MMRAISLAILLLATSSASSFGETIDCNEITSLPATISSEGIYCLKQSLEAVTPPGGPVTPLDGAITIAAHNVTLDLNGHTLSHATPGPAARLNGILALHRHNIIIRNGTITGFRKGILLGGFDGRRALVEDIRADGNAENAIAIVGEHPVIRNNVITNTGPSDLAVEAAAISVVHGSGGVISGNIISGVEETTTAAGIGVILSAGVEISGNSVFELSNATDRAGLLLFSARNIGIRGNHLANTATSGTDAIHDAGFSMNVGCRDNMVSGYTTPGGGCDTTLDNMAY